MVFLEDYTLLDEIGKGGFATVYKVRHNKFGYIRAIRVLNATIAKGEEDVTYKKFLEECKLLLRLGNGNHPHIVHIYQPLLRAQKALVEMDYVAGCDLTHYLKEQSFFVPVEDVLRLVSEISSALAYCHEDIYKFCMDRNEDNLQDDPADGSKVLLDEKTKQRLINKYRVIHNDIHSGNIIRRYDGSYVLLDFGLAIEGNDIIRSSCRKNGAPEFKAPEKWDNDMTLTSQSDIYSFGIVVYELLTGRVPFPFDKRKVNSAEAEFLLSQAHQKQEPDAIFSLRKAAYETKFPGKVYSIDYPEWLERLVLKCLAKKPEERFANGKELYDFVSSQLIAVSYSEFDALQRKNVALRHQVVELRERINDYDQLPKQLQEASKRIDTLSVRLSEEIENTDKLKEDNEQLKLRLSQTIRPGSKWKFFIILLLLVCIGLIFWCEYGKDMASSRQVYLLQNKVNHLDSLLNIQETNNVALHQQLLTTNKQLQVANDEIKVLKAKLNKGTDSSQGIEKDNVIKNLRHEISMKKREISKLEKLIEIMKEELKKMD